MSEVSLLAMIDEEIIVGTVLSPVLQLLNRPKPTYLQIWRLNSHGFL